MSVHERLWSWRRPLRLWTARAGSERSTMEVGAQLGLERDHRIQLGT